MNLNYLSASVTPPDVWERDRRVECHGTMKKRPWFLEGVLAGSSRCRSTRLSSSASCWSAYIIYNMEWLFGGLGIHAVSFQQYTDSWLTARAPGSSKCFFESGQKSFSASSSFFGERSGAILEILKPHLEKTRGASRSTNSSASLTLSVKTHGEKVPVFIFWRLPTPIRCA